ncbi:uracil phosphoribosyltransferase [Candidatus Epulonipiscium viviparus]|uniref:uracil phosphoribosyltransferase n=1 Tax=Candidatus Epulonipiscium viviparus TaxID=420336 RepID=UPI0004970FE6|nr:uracil phosphoribosyltransferase [Candidatus Epulopiscium viviparus]
MSNLVIIDHPLVMHKLSILRDVNTGKKEFREIVRELAQFMCFEATKNLPLEDYEITTPITKMIAKRISGKNLSVIPILRAGLGMVDGVLDLIPTAKVGHIGLYRDPETLTPVEYYCKLPTQIEERHIFVLDPMLATGGSAISAISFLKDKGCNNINFMCILAAPEGVEKLQLAHPDINIYVCAVDEKLNDHGYIVPGLGDAGDRLFGTK